MENSNPSQCKLVLEHLQSGKTLTPIRALAEYGIGRLGARILELSRAGHNIKTTTMVGKNSHTGREYRYAQYSLEK